jgi:peptide/nickel transport system permease protein
MRTYVIHRTLQALGVCVVISALSFFLLFLNTDPALLLLPPEAEVEDIALFKKQMGLDRPVIVQYLDFLRKIVLKGDFGNSFVAQVPAVRIVADRLPATGQLALASLIVVNFLSIPLGIVSAIRRYSLADNIASFISLIGQALPNFWFGLMLIIVFGVWLGWFPVSGYGSFSHIILPALTLGTAILPANTRLIRSGMLDVLNQDYVRTARAKGLKERRVLIKHAFKNAIIPVITVQGMQFGFLLGGAVLVEAVFAWPGIGRLAIDSILVGDYPVVQAVVVIFSTGVVLSNLAADILAAFIDPRIRFNE